MVLDVVYNRQWCCVECLILPNIRIAAQTSRVLAQRHDFWSSWTLVKTKHQVCNQRCRGKLPFKLYLTFCPSGPEGGLCLLKFSHMFSLVYQLASKRKHNSSHTTLPFSSPVVLPLCPNYIATIPWIWMEWIQMTVTSQNANLCTYKSALSSFPPYVSSLISKLHISTWIIS